MRPSIALRGAAPCCAASLAVLGAYAASGGSAATGTGAKKRQITCRLTLDATIKQPAPTAANFGSARCGLPYTGTLRITGGSSKNRRVRGTGTLTGFSPDAVKTDLTEVLALTGVG